MYVQMELKQVRKTIRNVQFGMRPSLQMPFNEAKTAIFTHYERIQGRDEKASQTSSPDVVII